LLRIAATLLPQNDPDFDLKSGPVAYWWLELDGIEGRREIGFDDRGDIVRFAPIGANRGVFVGEELAPHHLNESLTSQEFEQAWERALAGWRR
jgi:hypothetical protein